MRQFDRAALFIEACLKYGVMEANDTSNILLWELCSVQFAATLTQTLIARTQQEGAPYF